MCSFERDILQTDIVKNQNGSYIKHETFSGLLAQKRVKTKT